MNFEIRAVLNIRATQVLVSDRALIDDTLAALAIMTSAFWKVDRQMRDKNHRSERLEKAEVCHAVSFVNSVHMTLDLVHLIRV